jgi:hypothetical protein
MSRLDSALPASLSIYFQLGVEDMTVDTMSLPAVLRRLSGGGVARSALGRNLFGCGKAFCLAFSHIDIWHTFMVWLPGENVAIACDHVPASAFATNALDRCLKCVAKCRIRKSHGSKAVLCSIQ